MLTGYPVEQVVIFFWFGHIFPFSIVFGGHHCSYAKITRPVCVISVIKRNLLAFVMKIGCVTLHRVILGMQVRTPFDTQKAAY